MLKIILQDVQYTRLYLLSCGNAAKCCRQWCCVKPVSSCTTEQTLGMTCGSVCSFSTSFLHASGLVQYHCPCNQIKLLQSLMSKYCQMFYEQLQCN